MGHGGLCAEGVGCGAGVDGGVAARCGWSHEKPGWIARWVGRRMGEREAEKAQGLRMGRWQLLISKLTHEKFCYG